MKTEKYFLSREDEIISTLKGSVENGQNLSLYNEFCEILGQYSIDPHSDWKSQFIELHTKELRKIMPGGSDSELLRLAAKLGEFDRLNELRTHNWLSSFPYFKKGALEEFIEIQTIYTTDTKVIELVEKIKAMIKQMKELNIPDQRIQNTFNAFGYKSATGYFSLAALESQLALKV